MLRYRQRSETQNNQPHISKSAWHQSDSNSRLPALLSHCRMDRRTDGMQPPVRRRSGCPCPPLTLHPSASHKKCVAPCLQPELGSNTITLGKKKVKNLNPTMIQPCTSRERKGSKMRQFRLRPTYLLKINERALSNYYLWLWLVDLCTYFISKPQILFSLEATQSLNLGNEGFSPFLLHAPKTLWSKKKRAETCSVLSAMHTFYR